MQSVLKTKDATEWDKILHDAGVPAGLVLNVDKTRRLDQIITRGMVKTLPDGNEVLGSPMKYSTWNSYGLQKDSPKLDEDGAKIRKEFE
jgi:CoA:oxalate CoA-transferase